ncbi:hypothetical protein LRY60_05535 [Candidatus Woesebacteria bacterium]|nr:hypothetical protein [Candidatus Woesebacteria bacterium]
MLGAGAGALLAAAGVEAGWASFCVGAGMGGILGVGVPAAAVFVPSLVPGGVAGAGVGPEVCGCGVGVIAGAAGCGVVGCGGVCAGVAEVFGGV